MTLLKKRAGEGQRELSCVVPWELFSWIDLSGMRTQSAYPWSKIGAVFDTSTFGFFSKTRRNRT